MARIDSLVLGKQLMEYGMINTCASMDYSSSRKNGSSHVYAVKKIPDSWDQKEYLCSLSNTTMIKKMMHMESGFGTPEDLNRLALKRLIDLVQRKEECFTKIKTLPNRSVSYEIGYFRNFGLYLKNAVSKTKSLQDSIAKASESIDYELEPFSLQMVPPLGQIALNICPKSVIEVFPEFPCLERTEIESQLETEYRKTEFESCFLPISELTAQYLNSDIESEKPALSEEKNPKAVLNRSAENKPNVCNVVKDATYPDVINVENQARNETEIHVKDSAFTDYSGVESEEPSLSEEKNPKAVLNRSAENEPNVCNVVKNATYPDVVNVENQVRNETEILVMDSAFIDYSDVESEKPSLSEEKNPKAVLNKSTENEPNVCKVVKDATNPDVVNLENQARNETEILVKDSAFIDYWIERDDFFLKSIFGDKSDKTDPNDSFDSALNDSFESTSTGSSESCFNESDKNNLDSAEEVKRNCSTNSSAKDWAFGSECFMKQKRKRMDSGVDLSYDAFWNAPYFPQCNCESRCKICDGFVKEFEIGLESAKTKQTRGSQQSSEIEKSQLANENASSEIIDSVVAYNVCAICHQLVNRFGLVLNCEYLFCIECAPVPFGDYTLEMTPSHLCDAKSPGVLDIDLLQSLIDKEASFSKLDEECIETKVLNDWWCEMIWTPKQNETVIMNKFCGSFLDYGSIFVKGRLQI